MELAAHYEGLLEEQESSGLSVAAFAEEVGVSPATLYSWRRRLRGEESASRLVQVDVVDDEREEPTETVRGGLALRVNDRFRIELPADFDGGALARLLEVLDEC